MLAALSEAIEARDPYAQGHARRVTALTETLARFAGWNGARLATLRLGAQLHDIGKLAIEIDVLRKPTALTADELRQIRSHPGVGARMLEGLETARPVLSCVLFHHERWDGRGYPFGRAAAQIPVEARMLAIADAFDAMTSFRPYRPTLDPEHALEEVLRCAGAQFDPRLARLFAEAWTCGAAEAALGTTAGAAA